MDRVQQSDIDLMLKLEDIFRRHEAYMWSCYVSWEGGQSPDIIGWEWCYWMPHMKAIGSCNPLMEMDDPDIIGEDLAEYLNRLKESPPGVGMEKQAFFGELCALLEGTNIRMRSVSPNGRRLNQDLKRTQPWIKFDKNSMVGWSTHFYVGNRAVVRYYPGILCADMFHGLAEELKSCIPDHRTVWERLLDEVKEKTKNEQSTTKTACESDH